MLCVCSRSAKGSDAITRKSELVTTRMLILQMQVFNARIARQSFPLTSEEEDQEGSQDGYKSARRVYSAIGKSMLEEEVSELPSKGILL